MPEKYHGLTSVETRYRKRYLDLAANDDSREVFVKRARIIAAIRRFLDERGFVEVETPVLQSLYGGAWRARSSRITTSSSATSTCASPPSCTSSAASSAASTVSTSWAKTSATRA